MDYYLSNRSDVYFIYVVKCIYVYKIFIVNVMIYNQNTAKLFFFFLVLVFYKVYFIKQYI